MDFQSRFRTWQATQQAKEHERNRISFLTSAPLPINRPELFTPTKVKCLQPFYVSGKRINPGQVLSIEYYLAMDMMAINKVEFLE